MDVQPLTIRNATSTLVSLVQFERFEPLKSPSGHFLSFFTQNFTNTAIHPSSPTHEELTTAAESFHTEDVNYAISPFRTVKTSILPTAKREEPASHIQKATIRLIFSVNSQKYRLSLPTPQNRSTVLSPLVPNPAHEITAIYLPQSSYLTLFSSSALEKWMSNLSSAIPLSALSIPGTHNSPTYHNAMPSVRCQAVSVQHQLEGGIRFLDVRLQPASANDEDNENLYLVHAAFSVQLIGYRHFRSLVNTVYEFLEKNPTETILISLKREGIGKASDVHLARILRKHYVLPAQDKWYTEPRVPKLGEARGKLVLVRRFGLDSQFVNECNGNAFGIDATVWADNTPWALNPSGDISIQDFYEVLESVNVEKKIGYVQAQLARAAMETHNISEVTGNSSVKPPPLYINFMSGSNFWKMECWPERIAAQLNPNIVDYLCRKHANIEETDAQASQAKGDGSTGVVLCDWVGNNGDWDLVRCIVGMNAKLEMRAGTS
jgi:1-phosphatidylinositol phosphodiesterase